MTVREVDIRLDSLEPAFAAARRTALAENRHRAGLSPQLDVLVAREAEARTDAGPSRLARAAPPLAAAALTARHRPGEARHRSGGA